MPDVPVPASVRKWARGRTPRSPTPTDASSRPNFSSLAMRLKNIEIMALNIKYFGFELARQLAANLPIRENTSYRPVGLGWKPST